ncbi:N-acetylglucosamine-induced protein [Lachnellula hyalina]|uniref:N-acetylglucosamine-induced protein n=1 Tax=Lachnellula hyalina TaxID=1316788 RepID=A0A8H8R9F1_9HELO|nr:N-acetylglucosamine-induced protein [Lachnellula hyalina]TVY30408.1 N-acetylglucosamine-induced protein [Lachnellula hyalina]
MGSTLEIPYWQTNIPISQRTETCPPYLANLNPKDISILSTPDASYHILSWPEVRAIIAANRLDVFQRMPSELRRYLHYIFNLKRDYSSVMNFVLSQRLHWTEPVEAVGSRPFEEEADVKVLCNDWPYGIDGRIVHLVVWTKFVLEDDEATGGFDGGGEGVIWFKNWKTLKSVHAVEHFHVMLFDPDPEFVKEVTNGDVPLSQKVETQAVGSE